MLVRVLDGNSSGDYSYLFVMWSDRVCVVEREGGRLACHELARNGYEYQMVVSVICLGFV